ncbi:MAG TPA: hypothetical protein P5055_11745, partial [Candidatus Paceibacterota bacterium]|nr:hypothetical protein [Candidatus Paceibacterota bacterium]
MPSVARSVLECGSPLPPWITPDSLRIPASKLKGKRQRTAALHEADAHSDVPSVARSVLECGSP